jgi:hypothetical protein
MATFALPPRPKKANGTSRIRTASGIRTPGGFGIQDRSIIAPKNTNLDSLELSSRMAKFRSNRLQPESISRKKALYILFILIITRIRRLPVLRHNHLQGFGDIWKYSEMNYWSKKPYLRQRLTHLIREVRSVLRPPHATASFAPGSTGRTP